MNLAEKKKRNNISEYIIHMYQTEDLIRVYGFDLEKVKEYVIKHIPVEGDEKTELEKWYEDIAKKMKAEDIEETGHLKEVQQKVKELEQLKEELLNSSKEFKEVYDKTKPHIEKSLEYANGKVTSDVQSCLNGVYGLLLLRMNGKKVHPDLMESINAFGDVLSYLSYKYKQKYFMNEN